MSVRYSTVQYITWLLPTATPVDRATQRAVGLKPCAANICDVLYMRLGVVFFRPVTPCSTGISEWHIRSLRMEALCSKHCSNQSDSLVSSTTRQAKALSGLLSCVSLSKVPYSVPSYLRQQVVPVVVATCNRCRESRVLFRG